MDTKKILTDDLFMRIKNIEDLVNSAKLCIEEGDLFQAAVRLQMIESHNKFSEVSMRVLESESVTS